MQSSSQSRDRSTWMALWFVTLCLIPGQFIHALGPMLFGSTWYDALTKPTWHPPSFWFFVLVSVINYTGMGLALWQVWQHQQQVSTLFYRVAIGLFTAQLLVGFSWTLLVYRVQSILLGFVLDVIHNFLYSATLIMFDRISRRAFFWLLPAAVWLMFTTYLDFLMWQLNSDYSN